ncbi:hypothetical protein A5765_02310 [Mycolicibacterium celeriflavum]|uniref:hypothetical protein n=1 Tax=Mycolicibacterium celeriflavum TaxID=1249101 RepID=UPI0007FD65AA|nr:hypothetical protein [Mycolicibacterium celeriflavum]OBG19431.1 hypothetical protein A5765_02310 [Mycolicibacterium celeriflavum]
MAEAPPPLRGPIDTLVVIDSDHIDAEQLPVGLAISALTMAEDRIAQPANVDAERHAPNEIGL